MSVSTCPKMAASDYRKSERLHKDFLQEMLYLKEHIDIKDIESTKLTGYVQHISATPFTLHMYSEDQMNLHSNTDPLYLDATGSICCKIEGQDKRVLYYALIDAGPEKETTNSNCRDDNKRSVNSKYIALSKQSTDGL